MVFIGILVAFLAHHLHGKTVFNEGVGEDYLFHGNNAVQPKNRGFPENISFLSLGNRNFYGNQKTFVENFYRNQKTFSQIFSDT